MTKTAVEYRDESKYDFKDKIKSTVKFDKGLSEDVVREISRIKKEPKWMLDYRLKAYEVFKKKEMPTWGGDLSEINFNEIIYYLKSNDKKENDWEDVPDEIKKTFDRLGIPEAERKFLGGVEAQYDSETVYSGIKKELSSQGVIFTSMDEAVQKYPELVKEHFGKVVPMQDNKFAALNSAVWSGGSFLYIPKGVNVEMPMQAYFRINAQNLGQFERTLIIADEGSKGSYVEGCTAPKYSSKSLHAAVVEVISKKGAHLRYTTIQNWANNIYNLVTKRAFAYENATVEWVDGNLGSRLTMKYPSVYLLGENARADVISVAFAAKGQHQDTGTKIIHAAKNTHSTVVSKSISIDGGRSTYRGLLKVNQGATGVKASVVCDALLIDDASRTDTYPTIDIKEKDATTVHEATVGKIGENQIFYLMSKGLSREEALSMIILGFFKPFSKELPMEYSVELNRLIEMEMENSVG